MQRVRACVAGPLGLGAYARADDIAGGIRGSGGGFSAEGHHTQHRTFTSRSVMPLAVQEASGQGRLQELMTVPVRSLRHVTLAVGSDAVVL
jgi:hypothetical protein